MPSGTASGSRLQVPWAATSGTQTTRIGSSRRGIKSPRQVARTTESAGIHRFASLTWALQLKLAQNRRRRQATPPRAVERAG